MTERSILQTAGPWWRASGGQEIWCPFRAQALSARRGRREKTGPQESPMPLDEVVAGAPTMTELVEDGSITQKIQNRVERRTPGRRPGTAEIRKKCFRQRYVP